MTLPHDRVASLGRRRFISIAAAAAGAGFLPRPAAAREIQTFSWSGIALGAEATLVSQHFDERASKTAIEACIAEVARLEKIFSLHRPDSALVRLNRAGCLDDAPADLRILLAEALALSSRTNGAFDPTVQPLWRLYAEHFAAPGADPDGPAFERVAVARSLADWRKVDIEGARVRLLEPGMALTLNGIAQGYITDKIGELLRARGFKHVLVNMGEELALGPKWDGDAWRVGISDPNAPPNVSGRIIEIVPLACGAVATSGGYGCRFDEAGRFTHSLDPRTGSPAQTWSSVTVIADRATLADGLSTALVVAPVSATQSLLGATARAYAMPFGGGPCRWM